ncbi:MAG: hypothetical protein CSB55_00600 [Candidatus Cloacimonadota bacterium]|nr:MAG: hypothetical protein CSB55_00600 [Candidatus Cloacimonadota bacterium]
MAKNKKDKKEIFKTRIIELIGEKEAMELMNTLGKFSAKSIRINPENDFSHSNLKIIPWNHQKGFYWEKESPPSSFLNYLAGKYYIQEASAQLAVSLLASVTDFKNLKILDLTAAPGGKSLQTASLMKGGFLVSSEIIKSRCNPLRWNIVRERRENIIVVNQSPRKLAENLEGFFDVVIADAPCSGEGLFQKKKNSFEEWSIKNVKFCAKRQKSILLSAKKLLKKDGLLVYSTCTFAREENEAQIEYLLENGFSPLDLPDYEGVTRGISENEAVRKCSRRIFPHKTEGSGAFAAVVRKKDGDFKSPPLPTVSGKANCSELNKFDVKINSGNNFFFLKNDMIQLFSENEIPKYLAETALQTGLPVAQTGKKNKLLHGAVKFLDKKHCFDISKENLEKFVTGESFPALLKPGYYAITFKNKRLGLIKSNGKTLQNMLPVSLRMKRLTLSVDEKEKIISKSSFKESIK